MATQSVVDRDIPTLYNKNIKELQRSLNDEYLNKYYLREVKTDLNKSRYNYIILKTICSDNCEIIDFIEAKLRGDFDKPKRKTRVMKAIFEFDCDTGVMDDSDTECCNWKSIEW